MNLRTGFALVFAACCGAGIAAARARVRSHRDPVAYDSAATRVLIAGGGFAGLTVARDLARRFGGTSTHAIRLLDASESMTFWPMVPEVVSGAIHAAHVLRPLREELSAAGVEYVHADVTGGDVSRKRVETSIGDIEFDKLVIALGWTTSFFDTPGAREHCLTLESLRDAVTIRSRVIEQFESAAAGRPHNLTFIVVGGGSTGVELAASLADLVDILMPQYPSVDGKHVRVVVAQSKNDVLPHMEKPMRQAAASRLKRERIDVRTGSPVHSVDERGVVFASGERVDSPNVIWTAGVEANPVAGKLHGLRLDSRGRIEVDAHLRARGAADVYALGDIAAVHSRGGAVAPTAQAAVQEAATVAANVVAEMHGTPPVEFRYHRLGTLVELGGRFAVSDVFGFRFSGWVGQLVWRGVYLYKLGDWRDRLHVLSDWLVRAVEPPSVPRVRVE
jgi:NADH:quinone reductase (non-electrogenic)